MMKILHILRLLFFNLLELNFESVQFLQKKRKFNTFTQTDLPY